MAIKIFIDQGHNPKNPNAGAEGNGYREQDLVYRVGVALAERLNDDPRFEARLSRNSPDEILGNSIAQSLSARVRAANEWGADWFISIHANASDITDATGGEAYVYSDSSPAFDFAKDILEGMTDAVGIPDRGVFARPTLYVLRATSMPAVLLETAFITTPSDALLLYENPRLFAEGIYNGILKYFGYSRSFV